LLDEAGVDPDSFDKGVHAISFPHRTLDWPGRDCVACAVSDRRVKGPDDGNRGG
jgi:hypothetical protein